MDLPLDRVIQGNCVDVLRELPPQSVDLIFADPPYNLQLRQELWRPNMTRVDAVDDDWDRFDGFAAYDAFTREWLTVCRRVLKDTGAIWVIGSYHNIYRVGAIMQDMGFWFLNDVVWVKVNPLPHFRGVRFTNAHETLIWAVKSPDARYTFNYHAMKAFNDGLQMRSDWRLPICSGSERLRTAEGHRLHSTQKPEALLYRVILASSNPGDVVLDPFFGTGTTGVVAKKLHRHWIGIEREPTYVDAARQRIDALEPASFDETIFDVRDKRRFQPRIAFASLLERGLLLPGQAIYFRKDYNLAARLKPDGTLRLEGDGFEGSIHQVGKHVMDGSPCNGWEHWYFEAADGSLHPIDELRQAVRKELAQHIQLQGDKEHD